MSKVSIIVPVYNTEKYIKENIQSVLKQTYKDFELILIDDGSTDESYNICKRMQEKDERIILKHTENQGVSNARNTGLKLATGEYIMFLDSDDLYDEDIVERMLESIGNNDLCICSYRSLNNGKIIKRKINEYKNVEKPEYFIYFLQNNGLFNGIKNKMYKHDIILKNNLRFNKDYSIAEDLDFNLRYIDKIENIVYINEELYTYRISENGLNKSYHEDRISIRKQLYKFQKEMYNRKKYDVSLIGNEYLKICLSELKQLNWLNDNKKIKSKIAEIVLEKDREAELKNIKKQANLRDKALIYILLHKKTMFLTSKIIKMLKR